VSSKVGKSIQRGAKFSPMAQNDTYQRARSTESIKSRTRFRRKVREKNQPTAGCLICPCGGPTARAWSGASETTQHLLIHRALRSRPLQYPPQHSYFSDGDPRHQTSSSTTFRSATYPPTEHPITATSHLRLATFGPHQQSHFSFAARTAPCI